MRNFTHLHVHSEYSIGDGMASLAELYECAVESEQNAVALTDHGFMYGIRRFLDMGRNYPTVKPIAGCEIYLTDHYDHKVGQDRQDKCYHLVLLARNYDGYVNLCRISDEAATAGMRGGMPLISHDFVAAHSGGLICLSACICGEIPQRILDGDIAGARKALEWYRDVFGEDFYLEVSLHADGSSGQSEIERRQRTVNDGIFALAAETGTKVVATNDVHFARRDQALLHKCHLAASSNMASDGFSTGQEYMKSFEEMLALFPDHQEAVCNAQEVADKIERYEVDRPTHVPSYPLPEGCGSSLAYLGDVARCGLAELYEGEIHKLAAERLEKELAVVGEKGCADYFLHCMELVSWAEENGIAVGPGRGSSSGLLLNRCLGITEPDPLECGLLSERFYNRSAKSIPDIDFDFGKDTQPRVIDHLKDRFGKEMVTRVITFGKYSIRYAVKMVAKAFGLADGDASALAGRFPADIKAGDVEFFSDGCSDEERGIIDVALGLEGRICSTGIHACTVAVMDDVSSAFIPRALVERRGQRILASQYDAGFLDASGVMRLDILELHCLSYIEKCLSLIEERHGQRIDIRTIPLDDEETIELYRSGDTCGIFQFESELMRELLRQVQPDGIEDLTALNAMFRPGAMEMIPDFILGKRSGAFECEIEDVRNVLEVTYGVPVYQEQVMSILEKLAGFTPEEADETRRLMGRTMIPMLDPYHGKFLTAGAGNGYDPDALESLWTRMTGQAMYGFNKAHAQCYTLISYRCAWLKAHWPYEFAVCFETVE